MGALNDRLVQYLPPTMYVTATVCFVDAEASVAQLANAGGAYPVVIHGDNRIERVTLNGMPLGVFGADTFAIDSPTVLPLQDQTTVLLHTDGLLDLEAESGVQLEWSGLCPLLQSSPRQSPHQFLDALEQKLAAFRGSANQPDDINMVAMYKQHSSLPEGARG